MRLTAAIAQKRIRAAAVDSKLIVKTIEWEDGK
jgi:hypothetical protein